MISTMTELLELIYNKLHEILLAIKNQGGEDEPKPKKESYQSLEGLISRRYLV